MIMAQANSNSSSRSIGAGKTGRDLCYLCDLPRMPWSMVYDFSELVCRGCVNYEGTDRIDYVIQQARILKLQHGFISTTEPSRIKTSKSFPSSSAQRTSNSHESREGGPTSTTSSQISMQKTEPLASPVRPANIPENPLTSPAMEALSPVRPGGVIDLTRQYAEKLAASNMTSAAAPSPSVPALMSPAASLAYRQGMAAARLAAANWSQKNKLPVLPIPGLGSSPAMSNSDSLNSPMTPSEEFKPLTAPLSLDYTTKPPHVISVLQVLAKSTPFEVRFKKAHSERGRVFAFDASHKTGLEYELKLFIEYPLGSGQVYTSASGVAKQMYYNSSKELSKPLSSGFKYLEYEVRPDTGDWRLIGDLLPESIRSFKEPVKEEFLPIPRVDPNYPPLPAFSLNIGNESNAESGRKSAERKSPKRKQNVDNGHNSVTPAKRVPTLGSPAARRPNSLSLGITIHSPSLESSSGTAAASLHNGSNSTKSRPGIDELVEKLTPTEPTTLSSSVSVTQQHQSSGLSSAASSTRSSVSSEERSSAEQRMKCYLCCSQLDDAHYVQCPTIRAHKFCFPCSKDSIKHQQVGTKKEVFCPSGKQCPLEGGNVPWAFLPTEISHILNTHTYPKYSSSSSSSGGAINSNITNPDRPPSKEQEETFDKTNLPYTRVKQEQTTLEGS